MALLPDYGRYFADDILEFGPLRLLVDLYSVSYSVVSPSIGTG